MTQINETDTLQQSTEQLSCGLDEDTIVMTTAKGAYFRLNAVGSRIWELISRPISLKEIESQLQTEFEVDGETCHLEATAFLSLLLKNGLATKRPST